MDPNFLDVQLVSLRRSGAIERTDRIAKARQSMQSSLCSLPPVFLLSAAARLSSLLTSAVVAHPHSCNFLQGLLRRARCIWFSGSSLDRWRRLVFGLNQVQLSSRFQIMHRFDSLQMHMATCCGLISICPFTGPDGLLLLRIAICPH